MLHSVDQRNICTAITEWILECNCELYKQESIERHNPDIEKTWRNIKSLCCRIIDEFSDNDTSLKPHLQQLRISTSKQITHWKLKKRNLSQWLWAFVLSLVLRNWEDDREPQLLETRCKLALSCQTHSRNVNDYTKQYF